MNILKLSLAMSFLGIFILLLTSTIQPQFKTTGKIISVKKYNDFYIIKLNNNLTITCNKCNFQVNQTIEVTGKLTKYKGQTQIQAEKIKEK
jgi:hypothetical protein